MPQAITPNLQALNQAVSIKHRHEKAGRHFDELPPGTIFVKARNA
jgi:hypothetical protein